MKIKRIIEIEDNYEGMTVSEALHELNDCVFPVIDSASVAFAIEILSAIEQSTPYNPTGDCISREVINSEIEKRYCSKHCVVPSEEPYCPDNCPARFLKNIVKECPTVPQVTVFAENADEKAVADMKAELQNVIEARPNEQISWEQGFEAGLAQAVEITEEQAINKLHETGWLIGHDKEMERPQGKLKKLYGDKYYCSKCGKDCEQLYKRFCGYCGAELQ